MSAYIAYDPGLTLAHVAALKGGVFKTFCGRDAYRKNVSFTQHVARVACRACRASLGHLAIDVRHVEIAGLRHVLDLVAIVRMTLEDGVLRIVGEDHVLRCEKANVSPDPEDGRKVDCLECLAEAAP